MRRTSIETPTKKQTIAIRSLIIIGLLSIVNFFYWFLDFDLIEDKILYWMLMGLIMFDTFRLIYIWYHYWDITIPEKPKSKITPSVDVLTTYFPGEPKDMLKETLLAIKAMSYPHTTYLCDEGDDDELKKFCSAHQIVHVTRTNRINAKAGNINNALKQSTGEICLILDPDHVPKVEFLEEVIPYFEDPKIGFVQTVQSYYNMDESLVARAAAEQTFHFYGPVMMTMNSYGTVNAIGANCVFRRSALDSIGGHAAGLSEDMHTAMQLHAKGWKSIYVPKVLSAGLAPSTMSAYFQQQLKWSRGTLELLLTSFPRLFKKLSFRQKLHYGILPLHYLTGLFYMISFLIPIVSLLTSNTPWNGNVLNFGLITFPVIASILGIRFYVQKWMINKGERGMHLLGGLLMQITWSIYLMGFVYTLIRKKVPYLPTAKDNTGKVNFYILLPNLLVFGVCIFSVAYGLFRDFTPFSVFMSGFALWNALIMLYTLKFTYQPSKSITLDFETLTHKNNLENRIEKKIFYFWQKSAIVILLLILVACSLLNLKKTKYSFEELATETQQSEPIKYLGVFAPSVDDGLSDFSKINEFENSLDQKTDIVSFYIAWDKNLDETFPEDLILKTYEQNSMPMITWEPWLNTFKTQVDSSEHVFDFIVEGKLDSYIEKFALKIKNFKRPVFLRFAHEFDNPFYPWYDESDNASSKYKQAWKHTWEVFESVGAKNAIWVYNPWKADKLLEFFPGDEYVDWIGVNILNYATHQQPDLYYSFTELYSPFHLEVEKLENYPVMIAEFGTVSDQNHQAAWLNEGIADINNTFPEIKAIVYFDSNVDDNLPSNYVQDGSIDWTITDNIDSVFKTEQVPTYLFDPLPESKTKFQKQQNNLELLKNIKGVNLKSGLDWDQDYYVLSRKNLEEDFTKIRNLGLNTIKYTSNNIYDYNVVNISKEYGLLLSMGFWIPSDIDFNQNTSNSEAIKKNILDIVEKYKDQDHILSWSIQNDILSISDTQFYEPQRTYKNTAYINWLQDLLLNIKSIDPDRAIILELDVTNGLGARTRNLVSSLQGLDAIGLDIKVDSDPSKVMIDYLNSFDMPYLYTDISFNVMEKIRVLNSDHSFFISNWRDQHQINKLTFDGLVDRKGRFKMEYYELGKELKKFNHSQSELSAGIIGKLMLLYPGQKCFYYSMIYDEKLGWREIVEEDNFKIEWSLVKCDAYGNYLAIKEVGKNPQLELEIPDNYDMYLLRLSIFKDDMITTSMTRLNTPYN